MRIRTPARCVARGGLVGQRGLRAGLGGPVYAVDPNRALSQYLRERWGAEKGFPGGAVYAITQTPDGYLWLGTEKGLVRFDGWSFQLFQHATTPALPEGPVRRLLADAEGNLWITLRNPSLVRYRAGKFENALTTLAQPEHGITAMTRDGNGEALFSALGNGTLKYHNGKFVTLAARSELPNFLVLSMAETPDGNLWLGTRDAGLFRLTDGHITAVAQKLPDRKINCLLPDGQQGLWVGTDNGVVRWNGTAFSSAGVPAALNRTQALTMLRDRDANVWIGTASQGLLRLNANGVAALASNRPVTALFEDREGNLWVGSAEGLECVRDSVFVSYAAPEAGSGPVHVDAENRVWFAPLAGGLAWLNDQGQAKRVALAGLDNDVVYSLAGGNDELWLGRQRGGLTRWRGQGAISYTQADGLAQNSVYAVYRTRDGTVWAGTLSGGVSQFRNGKFTTYTSADGLASNTVAAMLEGADGTMWFATPSGLSAPSQGRWQTHRVGEGLAVHCLWEDEAGVLWLGTAAGLAYLKDGRVQFPTALPASLQEQVFGLVRDRHGSLWMATSNHVLRVKRAALLAGSLNEADLRAFGLGS